MTPDLYASRKRIACEYLANYDFGPPVCGNDDWVENMRDSLSCRVQIDSREKQRHLTFRVVFTPQSDHVRNVEVAETLPLM